jgi:intermediate cleaving peptidase 55
VREKDSKAELWDGARSGTQAAVDVFNADEVRIIGGRIKRIVELIPRTDRKY